MAEKESLTNMDVALFALDKLGGATRKVHTEHIAWEAYQMAPERFSWRLPEYRELGFPDKTTVRYALEQAKKKEGGHLVSGRAGGDAWGKESEGWTFTPQGVNWMKQNKSRIARDLKEDVIELHPREVNRFLSKVKRETAYTNYSKNKDLNLVTSYMFTDFLGCTPDASPEIVRKKLDRILAIATLIEDPDIIDFLSQCKTKFANLISE